MSDPYSANTVLLLHMEGSNNSTTFTDSSFHTKTITRFGDAKISTAQSKWGQGSGYFDGTGDLLSVANSGILTFGTGAFTIELWVYASAASQTYSYPRILASGNYNAAGVWNLVLIKSSGELFFDHYTTPVGRSLGILPDNTWTHLAISRDAANVMRGFKNGQQAFSATDTKDLNATSDIIVGAENTSGNSAFVGYLQDLRIANRALYTANFTPPAARLPDPDPPTGLGLPAGYGHDLYDIGAYRIVGNVDELGVAGSYRVRLFDRQSARCIRETWSAADGSYAFNHIAYRNQGYFAVAFDHGNNPLNAAIADLITPELMP